MEQGMTLMITDGVRNIAMGLTTAEEVVSVAYAEEVQSETEQAPPPE